MTPERMLALFGSRLDDYAVQQADGRYRRMEAPLTPAVMARHLAGEITVGAYQLDAQGCGRWLCIDLDAPEREWLEMLWRAAADLKVPESAMLREFSGRKGFHLWLFTAEPTEAYALRRLGLVIRQKSKVPASDERYTHPDGRPRELVEVYPKTVDLDDNPKRMGQLVKLPFGVHRATGQVAEPLDVKGPVQPMPSQQVLSLLAPWETLKLEGLAEGPRAARTAPNGVRKRQEPYPCTAGMLGATWGEGGRNQAVFLISKRLNVAGYAEDEVVERMLTWNREHCQPSLSSGETKRTARSGMGYTSMDCLNPAVIPFCSAACPIYAREHPATHPGSNGVGPKLKVTNTDPPLYLLPLAAGVVRVSHEELLEWERVRLAAAAQLHVFLARRRPNEWDRELEPLLRDVQEIEAPPEISIEGIIQGLLRSWLQRASDEPAQVARRNVWHDQEEGLYVFQGDSFLRYVRDIERGVERQTIWRVVRAAGATRRRREIPGESKPVDVWEVPVREEDD